jgi:hypothetical protein
MVTQASLASPFLLVLTAHIAAVGEAVFVLQITVFRAGKSST